MTARHPLVPLASLLTMYGWQYRVRGNRWELPGTPWRCKINQEYTSIYRVQTPGHTTALRRFPSHQHQQTRQHLCFVAQLDLFGEATPCP